MTIQELKNETGLAQKDIAQFFNMTYGAFANSSAKERYENALCKFYSFLMKGEKKKNQDSADVDTSDWEAAYLQKPSAEMIEKQERAFNAALAYEKNCLRHEAKYIDPRMAKIPKGEYMSDFAMRYGTTVKEMKDQWRQVESALANGLSDDKYKLSF